MDHFLCFKDRSPIFSGSFCIFYESFLYFLWIVLLFSMDYYLCFLPIVSYFFYRLFLWPFQQFNEAVYEIQEFFIAPIPRPFYSFSWIQMTEYCFYNINGVNIGLPISSKYRPGNPPEVPSAISPWFFFRRFLEEFLLLERVERFCDSKQLCSMQILKTAIMVRKMSKIDKNKIKSFQLS